MMLSDYFPLDAPPSTRFRCARGSHTILFGSLYCDWCGQLRGMVWDEFDHQWIMDQSA